MKNKEIIKAVHEKLGRQRQVFEDYGKLLQTLGYSSGEGHRSFTPECNALYQYVFKSKQRITGDMELFSNNGMTTNDKFEYAVFKLERKGFRLIISVDDKLVANPVYEEYQITIEDGIIKKLKEIERFGMKCKNLGYMLSEGTKNMLQLPEHKEDEN